MCPNYVFKRISKKMLNSLKLSAGKSLFGLCVTPIYPVYGNSGIDLLSQE